MRRSSQPRPELAEARQKGMFNIGEASQASGVSAKMIRHYEQIGLIPAANRTFANYRIYSSSDVNTLQFIKRARTLGFSMKEIATLLSLWQDRSRSSAEVKRLATAHVEELDQKIRDMQSMSDALKQLVDHCHGDHRPDCPIIDALAVAPQRRKHTPPEPQACDGHH
jgi:Cu(I)-responsive transcriptional regulator